MSLHDLADQERLLGGEPRCFSEFVEAQSRKLACACGR
jgi:hypothetical protein